MTQELDTLLQQALKLDAVDRAKLIDALARSLAEEAGIDPDAPITPGPLLEAGTVAALDANLEKARAIEDARIEAALEKARKRRE